MSRAWRCSRVRGPFFTGSRPGRHRQYHHQGAAGRALLRRQQQIGSLADYRTTIDATGPLNADKSLLYRINMSYENNGAPYGSFIDLTARQTIFVAPVFKWNIDACDLGETGSGV